MHGYIYYWAQKLLLVEETQLKNSVEDIINELKAAF